MFIQSPPLLTPRTPFLKSYDNDDSTPLFLRLLFSIPPKVAKYVKLYKTCPTRGKDKHYIQLALTICHGRKEVTLVLE
jgi:hypothetical protein